MPEGDQEHGRVAMALAVLPDRGDERFYLIGGQILATA
jgi:hypothetical protein